MKLILTGPESSGKTILAQKLSTYFWAPLITEYSREYLSTRGPQYQFEDLLQIVKQQEHNIETSQYTDVLIADTDWLSIYVWALVRFPNNDLRSLRPVLNCNDRKYLLCSPDIPWSYDPLRENPYDRMDLFQIFYNCLIEFSLNYHIINGPPALRTSRAIFYINQWKRK